jgi:Flp pilus assembly protein TadB
VAHKEDPSIRELASEFDGFKDLMTERDRRYEQRFEAMDEKTSLALTSSEKAVTKAETATEKRFDSVNEFRSTLSDQANTFLPKGESNEKFKAYDDRLKSLEARLNRSEGVGSGLKAMWGYVLAAIMLVIALISLFINLKR